MYPSAGEYRRGRGSNGVESLAIGEVVRMEWSLLLQGRLLEWSGGSHCRGGG